MIEQSSWARFRVNPVPILQRTLCALLTPSDQKPRKVRTRTITDIIVFVGSTGSTLVHNTAGPVNDLIGNKGVIATTDGGKFGTYLVSGSKAVFAQNKVYCNATCLRY